MGRSDREAIQLSRPAVLLVRLPIVAPCSGQVSLALIGFRQDDRIDGSVGSSNDN